MSAFPNGSMLGTKPSLLARGTWRAAIQSHGASVCWSAWAAGRWRTWQRACDNALREWTCCQNVFHPPLVLQWFNTASRWLWRHGNCLEIPAQLRRPRSFEELGDEMMAVQKEATCVTLANSHFFFPIVQWERRFNLIDRGFSVRERAIGHVFPSFL